MHGLFFVRDHLSRRRYRGGKMKKLMKGNEAIAEAAVRGGCRFFAGYPITPQNEIPEYLSWRLFEVGGQFVQSESEVAAINMVYGAAAAGTRAMTSSSSPGISLKQEGISYIAGAELPCVIINMVRGGPGRRYSACTKRLLPGDEGRRTRRLSYARLRSQQRAGMRRYFVQRF